MLRSVAVLAALPLALLSGCGLPPFHALDRATAPEDSWTVLTYSIADTDLEPFMMTDVDEMGAAAGMEGVNLVALVDRAEGYTDQSVLGLGDWTGARTLEVTPAGGVVVQEHGDLNTGDPEVLTRFIADSIAAYPAQNYALIISDHGASWPGVGGDISADHDSLSLAELDSAIGAGLEQAGVPSLDLLGFDACLMATYEVASSLAGRADRLLASQELEPGHGWDYSYLSVLGQGPATADQLGAALIDGFEAQARAEGTEAEITLSLVDLTAMPALDAALTAFADALIQRTVDVAPVVGRTLATGISFGRSPDPYQDSYMTDLGDLAAEIGVDALDVANEADAVVRAVNDVVLDRVNGQALSGATGLSIYFPPVADYFLDGYMSVESNSSWADFLSAYYRAGDAIPAAAQARFATTEADLYLDEAGLNIAAPFELAAQSNLAEAFIRYGVVEADGSITYLGEEPAYISEDGSGWTQGVYDLTRFVMSDGIDSAPAYFDLTFDDEAGFALIDTPMAYYAPGAEDYEDALLSIVLDPETGDILSETYYVHQPALGTYGELSAAPDGIIVPQLPTVLPDGGQEWIATSDVGLWADLPSLVYDLEDLPPGTQVHLELWVVDFGGNSDMVSGVATL